MRFNGMAGGERSWLPQEPRQGRRCRWAPAAAPHTRTPTRRTPSLAVVLGLLLALVPVCCGRFVARHQGMLPLSLPLGAYDGTSSTQQRGLLQASDRAAGVDAAEVAAAAGYPSAGAVLVSTAAQLVAAIADPGVQVAVLTSSVSLTEADWAPVAQPVVEVRRNLTLLGAHTDPAAWPITDFGYTAHVDGVGIVRDAKVRLAPGYTLTLRRLVLHEARDQPQFLFMGLDLLAVELPLPNSTLASAWPIVVLRETALWQRSCLPVSQMGLSGRTIPRPSFVPGAQNSTGTSVPRPPDCVNSSTAAPMARCWPARGIYNDMAMYAYDPDPFNRQTPAGYVMQLVNAPYWCDQLMTDECVKTNGGYVGCYYSLYPYRRRSTNTTTTGNSTAATTTTSGNTTDNSTHAAWAQSAANGNGSSGASGIPLAPVLGGILGGLAGLALIVAGLFVARVHRQRQAQGRGDPKSSSQDPSGSTSAVSAAHEQMHLTKEGHFQANGSASAVSRAGPVVVSMGSVQSSVISSAAAQLLITAAGNDPNAYTSVGSNAAREAPACDMLLTGRARLASSGVSGGGYIKVLGSGCDGMSGPRPGSAPEMTSGTTQIVHVLGADPVEPSNEDELALVPVTPLTPFQSHIPLDVKLGYGGGEVRLLPVTLGKGACGRVVQGVWCGRRVAVKLLHRGLFNAAAAAHGGSDAAALGPGSPSPAVAGAVTVNSRGLLVSLTQHGPGGGVPAAAAALPADGGSGWPTIAAFSLNAAAAVRGSSPSEREVPAAAPSPAQQDSSSRHTQCGHEASSNPTAENGVLVAAAARPGAAAAALTALAAAQAPAALSSAAAWWDGTDFGPSGVTTTLTPMQPAAGGTATSGSASCNSTTLGFAQSSERQGVLSLLQTATPGVAAQCLLLQGRGQGGDAAALVQGAGAGCTEAGLKRNDGAVQLSPVDVGQGTLLTQESEGLKPPSPLGGQVAGAREAEQQLPKHANAGDAMASAAASPGAFRPLKLAHIRMGGSSVLNPLSSNVAGRNHQGLHLQQPRLERQLLSDAPSMPHVSSLAGGAGEVADTVRGDAVAHVGSGGDRTPRQSPQPLLEPPAGEKWSPDDTDVGGEGVGKTANSDASDTYVEPEVSTLDAAGAVPVDRLQAKPWIPLTHGGAVRRTMAQEVEVLARLQHANIVQLLAANLNPACPCLVVELMDTSLDKVLYGGVNAAGPAAQAGGAGAGGCLSPRSQAPLLPLPKVLHIALQVVRALAYLHPTIIHRDLKPANVLVSDPDSASPVVKIADFGLSRLQDTVLITAHVDVGTAPYMAPEALDARNCVITHHSDMYSYGIMLYEMLAGARPWRGLNMLQIAVAVCDNKQRPRVEDLGQARCPPGLRALVAQCWDPVPERRPSAAEVAKQLAIMMQQL